MANRGDVRLCYMHQVGYEDIYYEEVDSVEEAQRKLSSICNVMLFLEQNNFIPDYANMTTIEIFDGENWEEYTEED